MRFPEVTAILVGSKAGPGCSLARTSSRTNSGRTISGGPARMIEIVADSLALPPERPSSPLHAANALTGVFLGLLPAGSDPCCPASGLRGRNRHRNPPKSPSGKDRGTFVRFTPHPGSNAELAPGSRGYGATMERKRYESGCRSHPTRSRSPAPPKPLTWGTALGSRGQCRRRHPPSSPHHAKPLVPGAPALRTP